ncbi:MAG: hypothetical protein C0404_07010 [Verrucomicrobia bacterium]|nr:hypothetical protein [Verrucomicrobiota bacterium]
MKGYYFIRTSRSWVNIFFFACGLLSTIVWSLDSAFGVFGFTTNTLHIVVFMALFGTIFGSLALFQRDYWALHINNDRLSWVDGKKNKDLAIGSIVRAQIEEGSGRQLVLQTSDGLIHFVSGDCYGDAEELRQWFRTNAPTIQIMETDPQGGLRKLA